MRPGFGAGAGIDGVDGSLFDDVTVRAFAGDDFFSHEFSAFVASEQYDYEEHEQDEQCGLE